MIQTSQLRGLEGNFQAQPRVFAHDAKEIVIGAINNSDANHGINMTSGGTLYLVGDTITFTTPTGGVVGDRAVLTVLAATVIAGGAGGVITDYSITTPGATYPLSQAISQAATNSANGTGFTATVTNIDIPNTQERGCCLYVGDVDTNGANVEVVMEGSNGTDTVIFKNLTSGSFLPILIKRIVPTNTNAGEFIALY